MGAVDYVIKDRLERLPFAVKRALEEAEEKRNLKLAEEALRKSEEKYRNIFENIQDVFFQTDLKGTILEISPSVRYFSEFTREKLVGTSVYSLYLDAGARDNLITEIQAKGEIRDYEIRIKSGEHDKNKYFSVNAKLENDVEGNPTLINGSIRDINQRKQSEEQIQKSEAKLNYAQKLAKMGSWDYYPEINKYSWSENMYRMLHLQPFELDQTFEDFINLVHPDDRLLIESYTQKILETKSAVSYEFRYLLANNEIIWIQNNITPVFVANKLTELHGVNIDITEKKQFELELIKEKENAQTSDRLKTAFMNNISHEIRTPLNGILGFGQILTDRELPAEEKENYFKMLEESSDRLLNTITNIMDISLLTSGNLKINKEEFNLDRLIHDIYKKFEYTCRQKDLAFSIQKNPAENDTRICTDGSLLTKILSQLIDNSIKFTSSGTVEISYELKENTLLISVKDSGIGISEKNKSQIFDNFMQEDNDNTRKYEGSGIGLSIVKGLTEILGGSISLESEKGKGSTFTLSIPIN